MIEFVNGTLEMSSNTPQKVTRYQAKAALMDAGLLDNVEAMMASPDTPRIVKLAWSEALHFERNSPTVAMISTALNVDSTTLDDLFIYASKVVA